MEESELKNKVKAALEKELEKMRENSADKDADAMSDKAAKKDFRNAQYWIQDYLARRPHSEKELRDKLKKKDFSSKISAKAIEYAKSQNWLEDPFELAKNVYKEWDKKNKSHSWINNYLIEKGLPTEIDRDINREAEKALYHLEKRFDSITNLNYKKAASGISSKGFIYEDFSKARLLLEQKQKGDHA
jgi:SOS response regulatory protein OraA/RecX